MMAHLDNLAISSSFLHDNASLLLSGPLENSESGLEVSLNSGPLVIYANLLSTYGDGSALPRNSYNAGGLMYLFIPLVLGLGYGMCLLIIMLALLTVI